MSKKSKHLVTLVEPELFSTLLMEARRRGISIGALMREYISDGLARAQNPLNMKFISAEKGTFDWRGGSVAAHNQLAKFISSDKGVALLASGYRASANSLWSGQSRDSAAKQEPIEEAAQCA